MKGFEDYPPILDIAGVADLLGISIEEVRRLSGEGWLPSARVGERSLFGRDEVIAWLRSRSIEPPDDEDPAAGSAVD